MFKALANWYFIFHLLALCSDDVTCNVLGQKKGKLSRQNATIPYTAEDISCS